MLGVDASVLANALADDGADGALARAALRGEELAVPDLVDVETVSVLRKRWLAGDLTVRRMQRAVADLADLALTRHPTHALMRRAVEMRSKVTPYAATSIGLGARPERPQPTIHAPTASTSLPRVTARP